jgi:hypothetical protein
VPQHITAVCWCSDHEAGGHQFELQHGESWICLWPRLESACIYTR